MRVEGYPAYSLRPGPILPGHETTTSKPRAAEQAAEVTRLTPQERLKQLIEEKQFLAEGAEWISLENELGKHVDLRV